MLWCTHSLTLITLLHVSLADILRIDDQDPAVKYSAAWTKGENIPDDPSQNWEGTLHYSNKSGETATLKFTGTSIAVYGSFHPPGRYSMESQYSVDGQHPLVFLPNEEVPASTHQILFYSSPIFPHGEHTLVVTNLGEQLFLDFFDVQEEDPPAQSSTTPAASTTGPNIPTQVSTSSSSSGGAQTQTVTSTTRASSLPASSSFQTTISDSQSPGITSLRTTNVTHSNPTALLSESPTHPIETAVPSHSTTTNNSTITPLGAAQSPVGERSRRLSKGAIAGIAVGGAIIVAVLCAGLWYYRRMRGPTWLATDLHFEPSKMTVPDPSFRGHRPTLPGFIYGERRASEQRRSARSSSVHLIGYSSSTPSTCSD